MKIYNLILTFSVCLLFLLTGGDALAACSDLQLLSNGVDYGSLSCDANGYVVANDPTGKKLIGYTVNTEVVTGKSKISGFTYSNNPADKKGKQLVQRKDNQGRNVVFVCNQSKTQAVYGGSSNPAKLNAIVSHDDGFISTEMKYDKFELCLLSEPTVFLNTPIEAGYQPSIGRRASIDLNENLVDGFQNTFQFNSANWKKPKNIYVYYGKDDSNLDKDFGFYLGTSTQDIFLTGAITKVKSTQGLPDPSKFNITLDYRLDYADEISPAIRQMIREVADEYEAIIKESSRTALKGFVNYEDIVATTATYTDPSTGIFYEKTQQGFTFLDTSNKLKRTYNHIFSEYFDDLTILVGRTYMFDLQGVRYVDVSSYASAGSTLINTTFTYDDNGNIISRNNSFDMPNLAFLNINLNRFNQTVVPPTDPLGVFNSTTIKNIIRHEFMHIFGAVNLPHPVGNTNNLQINCLINKVCFNGPISVAQYGQPLPLESITDTFHLDRTIFSNLSVIFASVANDASSKIYPLKPLDKAILADNGYCVDGVSASNCN